MKKEPRTPIAERFISKGAPHRTPEEWAQIIEDFVRRHPKKRRKPAAPVPDQGGEEGLALPDAPDGTVAIMFGGEGESAPE